MAGDGGMWQVWPDCQCACSTVTFLKNYWAFCPSGHQPLSLKQVRAASTVAAEKMLKRLVTP